jgi:hypothetical protein
MAETEKELDVTTGGYRTQVIGGETIAIDVEKKRSGFASGAGKLFAFIIGGVGILFGALLTVTIIGALIGLPMMFMSLGIIYLALGKQKVECPHCSKKQPVLQTAENFTCAKCRQLTVINWR